MGVFRIEEADRPHIVRLLIIWVILSAIGIVAVLQINYPPYDQSIQGQDQAGTLKLLTALATPVFLGVVMMIVYSAIYFRRTTAELVDGPPMLGNTPVQIAWVAISAIIVLFLAVVGIATLSGENVAQAVGQRGRAIGGGQTGSGTTGEENKEIHVQVIAQQWYFTYRYQDYGGVETTHLYLPVNHPVELHVTSLDIIHSFWAYQLGVKADANPGVDNIVHLTPPKTGYFGGIWLGTLFGLNDDQNTGVILGYLFATLAFLAGVGFLNYPLERLFGWQVIPITDPAENPGIGRFFRLSLDHKVIGIQYLVTILLMLLFGGIGAMLIRTSLLVPDSTITPPGNYISLIGLHAVMMIFITSAVIVGPFGNYLVPLMIGARRMAFPRLEALSFWVVPPAAIILAAATFWGGVPTGWTGYPPLSVQAGQGMDSYIVGLALIAVALVTSAVNMLATIIGLRAPGMTWTRLPILV